VRCKFGTTTPIAQSLSALGLGKRSAERLKKNLTFVIDALSVEDTFARIALERLKVDLKLRRSKGLGAPILEADLSEGFKPNVRPLIARDMCLYLKELDRRAPWAKRTKET
jgi:hypothetical protein